MRSQAAAHKITDSNNNNGTNYEEVVNSKRYVEKYSLRQRQKRMPGTTQISSLKAVTDLGTSLKEKSKSKAAPLSKYRRKTANARERTRMREINYAFENLRRCVPVSLSNDEQNFTNEKLTKITTLRLAMKYIQALTEALDNPNSPNYDISKLLKCKENSYYEKFVGISSNNKVAEPSSRETFSCSSLDIFPEKSKRKQKLRPDNVIPSVPQLESQPEAALLLESDGESLHFSEPCLSPLNQNIKSFCNASLSDDHLGLSLLFESDSDSIGFSESSYLNPLDTLDPLHPFPDLLHTDFTEQSI